MYMVEKNNQLVFVTTDQQNSIVCASAGCAEKVADDLADMSVISSHMLLFGTLLMMISLIYSKFPWELSSVPIFGSLLLSLVSLLGRRELGFYGDNREEKIHIPVSSSLYVYSHEYDYVYVYVYGGNHG